MPTLIPWIIALASSLGLAALGAAWLWKRPRGTRHKLPADWPLSPRPVFSTDERRVYRLLREALPHHVILCKLPLVRFCQPSEASETRYWFELLGALNVGFAICSSNGRVLAAIDLDTERQQQGRGLQIKQSVLNACRVRYLRCPMDHLPTAAELQLLVPYNNNNVRGPQAGTKPARAPAAAPTPLSPAAGTSAGRPVNTVGASLWQDSSVFQDSFFAPDPRFDSGTGGRPAPMGDETVDEGSLDISLDQPMAGPDASRDIVGVVVDSPRFPGGR